MDVEALLRRAVEQREVTFVHLREFPFPEEVVRHICLLGRIPVQGDCVLVPLCPCKLHIFCPYGVLARHGS